jgi:hypothetical protein
MESAGKTPCYSKYMRASAEKNRRLLAFDFDGTLAATFEKSPNGMCVELACLKTAEALFGPQGACAYAEVGGLQNRAPGQLLRALLEKLDEEQCIRQCLDYLEEHFSRLQELMPPGKGGSLMWNSKTPLEVMGEIFVRVKLGFLFSEVGSAFSDESQWPRPMDGLQEFLEAVAEVNCERCEECYEIAILSSGHDQFVRHCFEMWGFALPLVIVTDDDLRPMTHLTVEQRSKPSSLLLHLLVKKWDEVRSQRRGFTSQNFEDRVRMVSFFGDDVVRDGQLALNNGVPFWLYDPEEKVKTPPSGMHHLRSWRELAKDVRAGAVSFAV